MCLVDYEETDIVTQLRCDERHYFHTKCIEDWVKQGNNRCPFCRAPIIDFSRQNNNDDDADSLASSQAGRPGQAARRPGPNRNGAGRAR